MPGLFWGQDKVAHAVLYSILGASLAYGRHRSTPPPAHLLLIGIGALYGATDEWHQMFVRGRFPGWGDWIADVMGVVLGYTVLLRVLGRRQRGTESRGMGADV